MFPKILGGFSSFALLFYRQLFPQIVSENRQSACYKTKRDKKENQGGKTELDGERGRETDTRKTDKMGDKLVGGEEGKSKLLFCFAFALVQAESCIQLF